MLLAAALFGLLTSLISLEVLSGAVEDKFSCPHGWTRYGSKKCLKYVNELQDYERAQATCRSKNQGTLVTVHSHEEQNFVYSYIHSIAASSTPIWLGAKQIDFESILWLDKTENSYTNWAPSEPSHPDEICIAINPRNGQWHDVMCTEANVPACERAPTTQWPFFVAFCSEGWFQFNDEKCVRIISSQALNFYESQELCRSKYNSKLLSIKTEKESEFVHNLIKFRDVKLPVWLGAVQNDFSSFNWIDKSDVTFTNWAEGEPNDPDHACISMMASGGKWSDNDCKEQKLILCQKVVPEEGACETGWLQFRQDKCYRFVHIRLAFDDAESLCNNLYAGHLPSIHSQEEQFMISQFLASVNVKNGSEIWLGGRQMDFHNFNWGDGSLFNYSYWEQGEPSFPAEKCIEMSWRNGRWNDINCRLKRAVLCERQVTSRHHVTKPNLYQPTTCLDSNCTSGAGVAISSPGSPAGAQASAPSNEPASGVGAVQASPIDLEREPAAGLNASANGTALGADQAANFMLPPDDKPIRVISSIMNREQQPVAPPVAQHPHAIEHHQHPQAAAANASSVLDGANVTSAAFIHYNLPPPEKVLSANNSQQLAVGAGAGPVQNASSLSMSARRDNNQAAPLDQLLAAGNKDQKLATVASASQEAINQLTMAQQEEQTTVSLLDRIKPQQGATVAAPARSVSQAMTTDAANTTALGAPRTTSPQAMDAPALPQVAAPLDLGHQSQPTNNSESHAVHDAGTNANISTAQEFAQVTSLSTASGQQRERINPNDGQSFNQEVSAAQ